MIKHILDEIALEPGSNAKMDILRKYKDNELLKRVLYMAKSPRLKYYIKQLPEYTHTEGVLSATLDSCLDRLIDQLSTRNKTGNEARALLSIMLESSHPDDAYVIERIIEKDLKIGMGTSNINKVFPKLIEKTPYMGASSFKEQLARDILAEGIAYSQIKMDGRYCNAIIEDGEVYLESRSGEETYIPMSNMVHALYQFPKDCVLNGELTIDGIDRNESNGIINSVISISKKLRDGVDAEKDKRHILDRHNISYEEALEQIKFTVWDMVQVEEYLDGKSKIDYTSRLMALTGYLSSIENDSIRLIESKKVKTYAEAMAHFQEALARGEEGTILKSSSGTWKDGKPKWQVKMKLEMDLDMKIVGFNYGTEGTKNEHLISSLNVESSCGLVKTRPTGINEADMKYITENQEVLLGSIISMKCSGLSHDNEGNYSTLHPVFKVIRDDKTVANSLDEIKKIEEMIKTLH
jgi:hypothetical protein